MPDQITGNVYPPQALAAAADAIREEIRASRDFEIDALARAALEAAAPILADAVVQAILAHAERQHPRDPDHVPTAWHRHFSIAARVAAGAFDTREDQLRMAAQALAAGNYMACPVPEDSTDDC
jgi:hypothetical protein